MSHYDVLVEGAGSPAEINLRAGDIANMGFAEEARVPVVLVGDIDRGGVIASIFGTFELLQHHERELTKGFIVNKFRGDISLFDKGVTALEDRTGTPCFGVIPFFPLARRLPQEDALALDHQQQISNEGAIKVIGENCKTDCLILVETTVPPGTCEKIVKPIIESCLSKRELSSTDFKLGHSYERVMPGPNYIDSIQNFYRVYSFIFKYFFKRIFSQAL